MIQRGLVIAAGALPLLVVLGWRIRVGAWTELPESGPPHATADADLRKAIAALDVDTRTDLFNRARFPKSNIAQCARILLALRDRYFPGTGFDDVMTGMSGTRATWIGRHFRDGPLSHH